MEIETVRWGKMIRTTWLLFANGKHKHDPTRKEYQRQTNVFQQKHNTIQSIRQKTNSKQPLLYVITYQTTKTKIKTQTTNNQKRRTSHRGK